MMVMLKRLLLFILLCSINELAHSRPMYGSISAGLASEADMTGKGQTPLGISYSILFGFDINKNFAYEVGFTSLYSNASIPNSSSKISLKGLEVSGVGHLPISDRISLFARLGYANMDPTYSSSPHAFNLVGFVYGSGVQYKVDAEICLGVGYNIYNMTSPSGDLIVNNSYLSAKFSF
jgi:hypothetical protein